MGGGRPRLVRDGCCMVAESGRRRLAPQQGMLRAVCNSRMNLGLRMHCTLQPNSPAAQGPRSMHTYRYVPSCARGAAAATAQPANCTTANHSRGGRPTWNAASKDCPPACGPAGQLHQTPNVSAINRQPLVGHTHSRSRPTWNAATKNCPSALNCPMYARLSKASTTCRAYLQPGEGGEGRRERACPLHTCPMQGNCSLAPSASCPSQYRPAS